MHAPDGTVIRGPERRQSPRTVGKPASKVLAQRQARWAEILCSCNVDIKHWKGNQNQADEPSRRPDYQIGYERPTARLLATLATTTIELYDTLRQEIKTAPAIDHLAADVNHRIVDTPIFDIADLH